MLNLGCQINKVLMLGGLGFPGLELLQNEAKSGGSTLNLSISLGISE